MSSCGRQLQFCSAFHSSLRNGPLMTKAVIAKDVRKRFDETDVLRGLSLSIEQGTIFGLVGQNGAGKTTTVRTLLGLLRPDSGEVAILGSALSSSSREAIRREVGCLFAAGNLYPKLTVRQNLAFFAEVHGVNLKIELTRLAGLVDALEVGSLLDRRVNTLSSGESQKCGLIRALLNSPKLLFLDEPTANVDPLSVIAIRKTLKVLAEHGTTVFMTTHDLDEVSALCEDVAILVNGRVAVEGTPSEIARRSKRPIIVVHTTGISPENADAALTVPGVNKIVVNGNSLEVHHSGAIDPSALTAMLVGNGVGIVGLASDDGDMWRSFEQFVTEDFVRA